MKISPYDARIWQTFLSLAKTGSFIQTAVECDCTTSNVTRRIQWLEKEIGGRLVDRGVRPCRLTALGERP